MNYTKTYHLPQWEKSDRIMMEDFNAMCGNMEAGLEKTARDAANTAAQVQSSASALANKAQASADAAMAAAGRAQDAADNAQKTADNAFCPEKLPYSIGMYYGNNEETIITLGYPPRFVIVTAQSPRANNEDIGNIIVAGYASKYANMSSCITFLEDGFSIKNPGGKPDAGGAYYPMMNRTNGKYLYIAFR